MAFIEIIGPDQAEGRLAELYRRVAGPGGQVDNVLQVHSLRPHTLEGHMGLYRAVLHHPRNRLPAWYLEAIGCLVSHLNGCEYCYRHHTAGLQRLLRQEGIDAEKCIDSLRSEEPGPPFDDAQRAGLAYARRLTLDPGGVTRSDIETMRAAGLDDGKIVEINQVAAYFAYANRTVSGLGATTEGEVLGLSPQASDDPGAWSHG